MHKRIKAIPCYSLALLHSGASVLPLPNSPAPSAAVVYLKMPKKLILLTIVVVVCILGAALLTNAQHGPATPNPEPAEEHPDASLGVTFSPESHNNSSFLSFFAKAKETGGLLGWYGDWMELSNPKSGAYAISDLAVRNKYEVVPIVSYYQQGKKQFLRPLNAENKQLYLQGTTDYITKYQPQYFGIGIEINILYEASPGSFDEFVTFYHTAQERIKQISLTTQVFPVFQFERLAGHKGGLFNPTENDGKSEWEILGRFPDADMYGFTTYPALIYQDPNDIPQDYYQEIRKYTDKPVAFTEIGWQHNNIAPGWESDDAEEARFIDKFFTLTDSLQPKLRLWSFLYDPGEDLAGKLFGGMGLLAKGQTTSQAWEMWVEEAARQK